MCGGLNGNIASRSPQRIAKTCYKRRKTKLRVLRAMLYVFGLWLV